MCPNPWRIIRGYAASMPYQVDLDDVAPVVQRAVLHLTADAGAGVVEQVVDAAVPREHAFEQPLERGCVADIELVGLAGARERGGGSARQVRLAVGNDDRGTARRELPGQGRADARSAPGDEDDGAIVRPYGTHERPMLS